MSLITAENAKDIMLKNPVVTTEEEELGLPLSLSIRVLEESAFVLSECS